MKQRVIKNRVLIMRYYLAVVLFSIIFWGIGLSQGISDQLIFLVLTIYLFIFPIFFLFARKYAFNIFIFLIAFISGFYTYYHYAVEDLSLPNILYNTLQFYLFHIASVFSKDGSSLAHYPLIFEVARWSAALWTVSAVFTVIYRTLEQSILLKIYQFRKNYYVMFGYNQYSLSLIYDLRRNNKAVILIDENISDEAKETLEKEKVVVLHSRKKRHKLYIDCGLHQAKGIVLFYEKDLHNLNELMDINHYLKQEKPHKKRKIYIHLLQKKSKRLIEKLEEEAKKEGDEFPFQLEIRNMYTLLAKHLFRTHSIFTSHKNDAANKLHFLLIGFEYMGQHIAYEAIKQKNELTNTSLHISAIDKNMDSQKNIWKKDENIQARNVTFYTFDVKKQSIIDFLKDHHHSVTHAFICLDEEDLDFLEGIDLSEQLPDLPIYMKVEANGVVQKWLDSHSISTNSLKGIGTFKDILTEDIFLNTPSD